MAETIEFVEKGVKLEYSVADKMEEVAVSAAFGALTVWNIVGAAAFVVSIINQLSETDTIPAALRSLQRQIDEIKSVITVLKGRVDELVEQLVGERNRNSLTNLQDYGDQIKVLQTRLLDQPQNIDRAVDVANEAGVVADKFLRKSFEIDYELWRWADVVLDWRGEDGNRRLEPTAALDCFKNIPTLPVYVLTLVTWLGAREKVVRGGQAHRLVDDAARLQRHLAAVSIRDRFDKYSGDEDGVPLSIAEHIKYRIRAYVVDSTRYSQNNRCSYYHVVGSMMTGKRKSTPPFDIYMPQNNVLCTLAPNSVGSPAEELEMETAAGLDTLANLAVVLDRVTHGGPLVEPTYPLFPNRPSYPPAFLYLVGLNGDVNWYCNYSSSQPNGSTEWSGPKNVKEGWGSYARFFNAGGQSVYYIDREGNLFGQKHKGLVTGAADWSDTVRVGWGWNSFAHVFSGGENVIYAMESNGTLLWYKHIGGPLGANPSDWVGHYRDVTPPATLAGMPGDRLVFSGGKGNIYSVTDTGELRWLEHRGYLDGTNEWAYGGSPGFLGGGWGHYVHVVAAPEYVFYGLTADGELHWRRYLPDSRTWEGPITMLTGVPACRALFVGLEGPPPVVH